MRHKLKLIKISDTIYEVFIDGRHVITTHTSKEYQKDSMQQDKQKWLLALSKIPKRAKLIHPRDDKEQYKGRLMGGWLCDSKCLVYGIFDGSGFRGLAPCIVWIPTKAELDKLLYRANKGDDK